MLAFDLMVLGLERVEQVFTSRTVLWLEHPY